MNDPILTQIKEHLEFLGFQTEVSPDDAPRQYIKARHPTRPNMYIARHKSGVLFSAPYATTDEGKKLRGELLDFVNTFNALGAVCRAYVDKDGDIAVEAWFPGVYLRPELSVFLDLLSDDVMKGFSANRDQTRKLLK